VSTSSRVALWPPSAAWAGTWRGLAVAALHPFLIVVTPAVAWTGVALSIGLLPLALLGVPVFGLTALASRGLAAVERSRVRGTLGIVVEPPRWPDETTDRWWWSGALRAVRMGATWREIFYHALALPLAGGVLCCLALGVPGFGIGAVVAPWVGEGSSYAWIAAGVVALLATPLVVQLTAAAWAGMVRSLLGTGRDRQLTERVEQLTESRDALARAAQAERERIERDLHDGAQQRLVSLTMNLGIARSRMERDPAGAAEHVTAAQDDAKAALAELRDLARGIHPVILADRGLDAALSAVAARCPVPVTVDVRTDPRPPAAVEAVAYFVVAESLTNVARHSGATRAWVTARRDGDTLTVEVGDDGHGGADPAQGSGLAGLASRVAGAEGTFAVTSPAGGPTVVEAVLPCAS
jgi:signal transduction histidine kinase